MFLLFQCSLTKVKHIQISFGNEHVAQHNIDQVHLSEWTFESLGEGFKLLAYNKLCTIHTDKAIVFKHKGTYGLTSV